MARYLVTGGSGFIGSHIAAALARAEIRSGFSTTSPPATARTSRPRPAQKFIEGDIRSYHIVREAVEGCDVVLHQAALPSVPRSVKDPITSNEVNVVGTLNVLDAARRREGVSTGLRQQLLGLRAEPGVAQAGGHDAAADVARTR